MIVVPDGVVTRELDSPEVIQWISDTHARSTLTASVCTGAFLLAKAAILSGMSAGIDMSPHLVERLAGRDLALATARQLDFDWHQDG